MEHVRVHSGLAEEREKRKSESEREREREKERERERREESGEKKDQCFGTFDSISGLGSNFPDFLQNPPYNYMSIMTLHLHTKKLKNKNENISFYHKSLKHLIYMCKIHITVFTFK